MFSNKELCLFITFENINQRVHFTGLSCKRDIKFCANETENPSSLIDYDAKETIYSS